LSICYLFLASWCIVGCWSNLQINSNQWTINERQAENSSRNILFKQSTHVSTIALCSIYKWVYSKTHVSTIALLCHKTTANYANNRVIRKTMFLHSGTHARNKHSLKQNCAQHKNGFIPKHRNNSIFLLISTTIMKNAKNKTEELNYTQHRNGWVLD
jgi:hypothetical protein